eukprot:130313_1
MLKRSAIIILCLMAVCHGKPHRERHGNHHHGGNSALYRGKVGTGISNENGEPEQGHDWIFYAMVTFATNIATLILYFGLRYLCKTPEVTTEQKLERIRNMKQANLISAKDATEMRNQIMQEGRTNDWVNNDTKSVSPTISPTMFTTTTTLDQSLSPTEHIEVASPASTASSLPLGFSSSHHDLHHLPGLIQSPTQSSNAAYLSHSHSDLHNAYIV